MYDVTEDDDDDKLNFATAMNIDFIKENQKEKYEFIIEEILDRVFRNSSYISREVWHEKFAQTEKWLFNPKTIREKLGATD